MRNYEVQLDSLSDFLDFTNLTQRPPRKNPYYSASSASCFQVELHQALHQGPAENADRRRSHVYAELHVLLPVAEEG